MPGDHARPGATADHRARGPVRHRAGLPRRARLRPPSARLAAHPPCRRHLRDGQRGRRLSLPKGARPGAGVPRRLVIEQKFVGERALVERCVVTLAGERGLLLVGEPGTAKSLLSELLSAAVCGTSALTVQGTAGTTEDQLKYGWNYALLLAQGPTEQALVPSPVLTAMNRGAVARVEEVTRCLPEVQDALVSLLSERRIAVPELAGGDGAQVHAAPGFTLIATANLRDKGVSEMSAALKRRFSLRDRGPHRRRGRRDRARPAPVACRGRTRGRRLPGGRRGPRSPRHRLPGPARRPLRGGLGGRAPVHGDEHGGGRLRRGLPGPGRRLLPRRPGRALPAARPSARRRPQDDPPTRHGCWGTGTGRCAGVRSRGSATWRALWDLRSVLES